jgi:hypothetical protein
MGNETISLNGQVSRTPSGQGSVSAPILLNDIRHYRPGILIFSRRQKSLCLNRRALELTGHLSQADIGAVCEIPSTPVHELRNEIQAVLDHRRDADIWERFEMKRIIVEARRRILVRGFGLADQKSHDDSQIVIVLEELGLPQERCETGRQVNGLFQDRGGRRSGDPPSGGAVERRLMRACNGGVPERTADLDRISRGEVSQRSFHHEVRGELVRMEAKWSGPSQGKILSKQLTLGRYSYCPQSVRVSKASDIGLVGQTC